MKSPKPTRVAIVLLSILMFSSCVSRKEMVYFQNIEELASVQNNSSADLLLKADDLLTINVSAPEQTAAIPFNLPVVGVSDNGISGGLNVTGRQQMQTYRVNNDGQINFPVLGIMEVDGLSPQELEYKLGEEIKEYVQDPIVNVRLVNFQISVLGEVNRPGTFTIDRETLSLPVALGIAGDLSIYGKRKNVLVMREKDGDKIHAYLDLTDANVINSPFYYLQQNDVVYVEPNGAQLQGASYNRNAGVYISIASVLISLFVLINK